MQVPAIEAAKDMGWYVILADGNAQALATTLGHAFEHVDLADPEGMLAMARIYHQKGLLHGVFTAGTDFSATVAYVAEALDLPGISHEAALNASIKSRMRACFKASGVPSPAYAEIGPEDVLEAKDLNLPLVVKPVDSMGARGASKVSAWHELDAAIFNARSFSRSQRVIVEEFIEGPEYSIDSLVFDGKLTPCGLARRHIHFPPYFVELGHTLPSDLNPEQVRAVEEVLSQAAKALGITHGAAKGDIFMTERGPMVGEIAARLSGGYMSGWTFPYASGVELTKAALLLAVGQRPASLAPSELNTSAERAIVSIPGVIKSIHGVANAKSQAHIRQVFLRASPGSTVVFPRNNVEKTGNVIASAPRAQDAVEAAIRAVQSVDMELLPFAEQTLSWLAQPSHHPEEVGSRESWPQAYPALFKAIQRTWRSETASRSEKGAWLVQSLPSGMDMEEACPWDYRELGQVISGLIQEGLIELSNESGLGLTFWYPLARGGRQAALFVLACLAHDRSRAVEAFRPEHFG